MPLCVYGGIDPGASGGIAFISATGQLLLARKMGETEHDTAALLEWPLAEFLHEWPDSVLEEVTIEKVGVMPAVDWKSPACPVCNQRRTIRGANALGSFMQSYGFLRGLLTGLRIRFEEVPPQTWQRYMHCLTHGDKNISKAKAQQLFPNPGARITHATADAILLAEFGRLKALGRLPPPIKIVRTKPDPRQARVAFPGREEVEDF
jgi:hypothetical protein